MNRNESASQFTFLQPNDDKQYLVVGNSNGTGVEYLEIPAPPEPSRLNVSPTFKPDIEFVSWYLNDWSQRGKDDDTTDATCASGASD